MGGYAASAVWIALYKEVSPETDDLLRGAAYFLLVYAGIVHFQPFANGMRRYGGFIALILYVSFAFSAAVVGATIAEFSLTSDVAATLAGQALGLCAATALIWCLCAFSSQLKAGLDRGLDLIFEAILRRVRRLTSDEETS
jgi:hypothetical protein